MTDSQSFRDNNEAKRYELAVDGGTIVATYNLVDGQLVAFSFVVVPEGLAVCHAPSLCPRCF